MEEPPGQQDMWTIIALTVISIAGIVGGIIVGYLQGAVGSVIAVATAAVGGIVAIALRERK